MAALALPALGATLRKGTSIEIDGRADDAALWLGYALGLSSWASASGALEKAPLGRLTPTFEGELQARRTMIVIWREMLQKEPKSSAYLDAMARVDAAGFLPEYVWTVHWRSGWTGQPPDRRIAEFYAWQRQQLVGHAPHTGAWLRVIDADAPPAPASAASR